MVEVDIFLCNREQRPDAAYVPCLLNFLLHCITKLTNRIAGIKYSANSVIIIAIVLTRRLFLDLLGRGSLGILALPLLGFGEGSKFHFTQVIYNGNWEPRPTCHSRLMASLEMRTSIDTSLGKKTLRITDDSLFSYPFLYLAGRDGFGPLSEKERSRLRRYLKLGGTLLIDDSTGTADSPFDAGIREEFKQILPQNPFTPLLLSHAVYKSFYLLYSASGRKIIQPRLQGITFEDENRTPVLYCRNDLGGAWSEDAFGKWKYACVPGGERQRELAMRLGINIILYALTGNYKTDQVHIPFIKRRQRAF